MSDQSSDRAGGGWMRRFIGATVILGATYGIFYYGADLRASLSGTENVDAGGKEKLLVGDLLPATVERKPFEVVLNVQGHLDSRSNATLTCQVEGSTTIISIIPEGTWVEAGDIVCELDSSKLTEDLKQQQIDVTQAEAKLSQASESLEIQQTQNESDIAAAELNATLAALDREKYEDGEYPAKQRELAGEVAIQLEEYRRAEENYEFTKRLVRKGYETPSDLESKRIAVKREELELQKAQEDLKVLTEYTKKRDMAELEANMKEYTLELARVKLKAKSAETQAKAEVDSAKLTLEVEREKLDRYRQQLAACTLRAPQAGEVVYANLSSSRRGSDGAAIEEGAQVRERQAIINLPDVTQMKVSSRVHESLISKFKTGLHAEIRVDAYPNEIFNGEVAQISSVPMTGSWPNYDLREYQTEINLVDDVDKVRKLRPGLTTQVEIFVDQREDVLQVPQQAVVKAGKKTITFVVDKNGVVTMRVITLGMTNSTSAEVLDGLKEGERVVLNPRNKFSERIAEVARIDRDQSDAEDTLSRANQDDVSRPEMGTRDKGRPAAGGRPAGGKPGGPRGAGKGKPKPAAGSGQPR